MTIPHSDSLSRGGTRCLWFGGQVAFAGTLGWRLGWELDPGGGVLVSVAQFFFYLPSQPVSSGQAWVERDILLLISNLQSPTRVTFGNSVPTPTSHRRLLKANGSSSELGGLICWGFRLWGVRSPSPSLSGLVFWGALGGSDF